ncbi:MAG: hypothetical protein R2824_26925 [Saprospiraceae bacterium]|nr:hypothetical protein [Lewinella sp.]
MAISLTAEAIILAINSAIKLGDRLQRAYANSIKAKAILLPLPQFNEPPNVHRAHRYFEREAGVIFPPQIERLKMLYDTFELSGLGPEDEQEYIDYYIRLRSQLEKTEGSPTGDDSDVNLENMLALLRVRQWESGKIPRSSPIKMVAGTLVEIGIDYFNQVPGALNPQSSLGRIMKSFLSAIDDIEIVEAGSLKEISELVVPRLFITAAESLEVLSKDISSDEKIQAFISATSRGIADEVIQRTRHAADEEAVRWGELVLRSMVKNAGKYVFNAPGEIFNTNEGMSRLIQNTGRLLLEAILSDPDGLNLKEAFNIDTLDRVTRAALGVIAEHPNLIDGRDGMRQIIMGVSAALAEAGLIHQPHLLPDLVQLILEHTAGNFHLIVRKDPQDEGTHLLVIAVQQFLLALAQSMPDGKVKFHLPKGELLLIAEHILDEVVTNPNWVLAKTGEKTLLRETLEASFRALSRIPRDQRLNREALQVVIRTNIRTVVTNQAVLNRVKWGTEEQEVTILQKAMDLVFHFIFESGEVAPAERIHLLSELLRYISKVILAHHPDERGLLLIDMILFQDPNVDYSGGFNPRLADDLIGAALNVLQTHPELISRQLSLQGILAGVAKGLQASSFRKAGLLPELTRLILNATAKNIHLIVRAEAEAPQYLLVLALQQILAALSVKPEDTERWQPRLTAAQLIGITENIFDQLVHHPQWLTPDAEGNSLFGAVVRAIFGALQEMPKGERLQSRNLELIIQLSLSTAIHHPQLLDKIHWGEEEEEVVILQHVFRLTVSFVFDSPVSRGVKQLQLFIDLLHYILEAVMRRHPNKKGLLLIDLILFEDPDIDFSEGFRPELADQLINATLKVLDYRPDLITNEVALQHIIEGVAGALKTSGYRRKGLLPELLRLILECSADNLQLIIRIEADRPDFLLVTALQQLLMALSTDVNESGQWRPELSGEDILSIVTTVFDDFLQYPEWVLPKDGRPTFFKEVIAVCLDSLRALPPEERLHPSILSDLLRLGLQTAATSPHLLHRLKWGSNEEEAAILQHALQLTISFVFERSNTRGGQRLELFTDLVHFVLEMLMARYPDKKGLLLLDLILFEDPDVDYSRGFDPNLCDDLFTAAIRVLDYRPDLLTDNHAFQHIIEGVTGALKNTSYRRPGLLSELIRLILECTAENIQLIVSDPVNGNPRYLLVVALQSLLRHLSRHPEEGEQWHPHLNTAQMLDIVEEVLDYLVVHSHLLTDQIHQGTLFSEAVLALFNALAKLPRSYRLQPAHLSWLLQTTLRSVAESRLLLSKIKWGPDEEEAVILQKALDLVFAYAFPAQSPDRGEALETLLEYVLEFILRHHQDKKALLLLYLILFEDPLLGRRSIPKEREVEDLIEVALQLLEAHPELITQDGVWQKIIQDTSRALRDSRLPMPELLPELLRLTLLYTAENADLLTKVSPNSRQYVLTVAMEQVLRAIAEKPKRGTWKPQLSSQQILDILELCLEVMIRNPLWVKNNMLQIVLISIFEALQSVPEERKWPYATIRLLIENGLKAVSFRKNLVIEVVHKQGRRQIIALTYALENLLVTLYQEDEATEVATWTLTQTNVLDAILDNFLLGLVEGPITKAAINEALQPVKDAIADLANNTAFSLEDLLEELKR